MTTRSCHRPLSATPLMPTFVDSPTKRRSARRPRPPGERTGVEGSKVQSLHGDEARTVTQATSRGKTYCVRTHARDTVAGFVRLPHMVIERKCQRRPSRVDEKDLSIASLSYRVKHTLADLATRALDPKALRSCEGVSALADVIGALARTWSRCKLQSPS